MSSLIVSIRQAIFFFWFGFQMLFFGAKFYSSTISRHYLSASLWHSETCLESVSLKISMCKQQTCQAAGCKKTKPTVKGTEMANRAVSVLSHKISAYEYKQSVCKCQNLWYHDFSDNTDSCPQRLSEQRSWQGSQMAMKWAHQAPPNTLLSSAWGEQLKWHNTPESLTKLLAYDCE